MQEIPGAEAGCSMIYVVVGFQCMTWKGCEVWPVLGFGSQLAADDYCNRLNQLIKNGGIYEVDTSANKGVCDEFYYEVWEVSDGS